MNNVPGKAPGARHTKDEIAARLCSERLCDAGTAGRRQGGWEAWARAEEVREGAMEEGGKDAGNGVRLFPACAKAPVRGPSGSPICKSGGLGMEGYHSQAGTGFQAGSSDVTVSEPPSPEVFCFSIFSLRQRNNLTSKQEST